MGKEKKKLLIITASPRKKGNTLAASKIFKTAIQGKFRIKQIRINDFCIEHCTGCLKCRTKKKCVIKDDARCIIALAEKSSVIAVFSPVYFTGVPSALKAFIDRNQPLWFKNKNKARVKKGIIVLLASETGKKNFFPAETEIKSYLAVNRAGTVKVLRLPGMDGPGDIEKNPAAVRKIIKIAKRLV